MTADRGDTGATNDDRADIACTIGPDIIPNIMDALGAAERILASQWLAETIAGAKAEALEEAAAWAGCVADHFEVGGYRHGAPGWEADLSMKYDHASAWLIERAESLRTPSANIEVTKDELHADGDNESWKGPPNYPLTERIIAAFRKRK